LNVESPITLIGNGRSGTTLIEACLNLHPQIQTLNETGGIIFGLAAGACESYVPAKEKFASNEDFAGFAIRQTLLSIEPTERPYWFHKPIGIPKLIDWRWQQGARTVSNFPVEWYWKVLMAAFPSGKFMTCLRNPWDVVLSWERFAGWSQRDVWRDVCDVYEALAFEKGNLRLTVFFDDLIETPEKTLRYMLEAVGAPYDDAVVRRLAEPQAMKSGDQIKRSHKDRWDHAIDPKLSDDDVERIVYRWKSAGKSFESPSHLRNLFQF
jgi:hypothetical protein